ncbi:MAG TPA: NUDIX domain-containing protein [Candidatus Binatia bacterium]|nr:NUDIX domain-containing protein [Candidatus Binatia bacterium]
MARLRTERATSAGGIVVRVRDGRLQLVVGMRRRERGVTWTLPKGTPRPGETLAETALREVGEETGLVVEIKRPIGSIRYTFTVGDTRIEKTVHYFLMAPRGGHLAHHDREFARVRWVDLEAAPSLLSFETERELVARVAALLTTGGAGTTTEGRPAETDAATTSKPSERAAGRPATTPQEATRQPPGAAVARRRTEPSPVPGPAAGTPRTRTAKAATTRAETASAEVARLGSARILGPGSPAAWPSRTTSSREARLG